MPGSAAAPSATVARPSDTSSWLSATVPSSIFDAPASAQASKPIDPTTATTPIKPARGHAQDAAGTLVAEGVLAGARAAVASSHAIGIANANRIDGAFA